MLFDNEMGSVHNSFGYEDAFGPSRNSIKNTNNLDNAASNL